MMNEEEKKLSVKLAFTYYQNKEYKKAINLYKRLYEEDKNDFNILNMLGDAYLKDNQPKQAIEAYIATLIIFEQKEMYDKMVRLIKKLIKTYPDEQRLKNKLKIALRSLIHTAENKAIQHEYKEAKDIYENIKEFDNEEFPIIAKLKQVEEEEKIYQQRTKKIEETKKETVSGNEDLIAKFDKMAQNYIKNGDYDGAVETYITALKLAPSNNDLRQKLHNVYLMIAQQSMGQQVGQQVWEKIDKSPVDKLAEAKRKALEERQMQIIKEEEERAKKLLEEEEKIQQELEQKEAEIIQAAAVELKQKLEDAQKKEKLKKEEIQRIMKEQEQKKRELLERAKKEAIEKWKKQRETFQQQAGKPVEEDKSKIFDTLKKSYEVPKLGTEDDLLNKKENVQDNKMPEIEINNDNLDSIITTAYIYINQGQIKEALHIYNKIYEKFPDNPEVKHILEEITKRQKL